MKIKYQSPEVLAIVFIGMILMSGCIQQETLPETTITTTYEKITNKESVMNSLTYENSNHKLRIKYPDDWIKQERVMGTTVIFLSPPEGSSDTFQENLNVIVQDLSSQPMTLDRYTRMSIEQITQFITDFNVIDSRATTLAGNRAHKVVYTGRQGQYNLMWMQIWTIKDNKAYVVTYTAEISRYSEFLGTAQEMFTSFEII